MLTALAVIVLVIAIVGGIVLHPLAFLLASLALIAFVSGRSRTAY
jgi:hypothetical protein